jgi:hypothetical protein
MMTNFKNYWSNYKVKQNSEKSEIELIVENFDTYYDVEFLKAIVRNFNFPLNN